MVLRRRRSAGQKGATVGQGRQHSAEAFLAQVPGDVPLVGGWVVALGRWADIGRRRPAGHEHAPVGETGGGEVHPGDVEGGDCCPSSFRGRHRVEYQ